MDKTSQSEVSVSRQAENLYRKLLLEQQNNGNNHCSNQNQGGISQKLFDKVYNLLFITVVHIRYSKMTHDIIQSSVESLQNFDAEQAAKAFQYLEQFAKNLVHYPWKHGYKKIKIYSGFVKLKIERCLKGTKAVFEALGYRRINDNLVLQENVSREERELIALDCYVAFLEMTIYKEIYDKVSGMGYGYIDVHRCRQKCHEEDLSGCEMWIVKHCVPRGKPGFTAMEVDDSPFVESRQNHLRHVPEDPRHELDIYSSNTSDRISGFQSQVESKNILVTERRGDKRGRNGVYATGTIDDHVLETMRILNQEDDKTKPTAPPPSYQSASQYPSEKGYDEEWGEVRTRIEEMGDKYHDPGGRGDILKGDHMIPKPEVKCPPSGNSLFDTVPMGPAPALPHRSYKSPQSTAVFSSSSVTPRTPVPNNVSEPWRDRKKQFSNDNGRVAIEVDGPPASPILQSDALYPSQKREDIPRLSDSEYPQQKTNDRRISPEGYTSSSNTIRDQQRGFSTFRGTDAKTLNSQYLTNAPQIQHSRISGAGIGNYQNQDGGANDVYVSLRETDSTNLHYGKPSFENNFQKTTQRFYQADSVTHSLPLSMNRKHFLAENITKTAPPAMDLWQCDKCTYANAKEAMKCEICGASREKGAEQKPLKSGGLQCPHCTLVNEPDEKNCVVCHKSLKGSPTYI